MESQEVFWTWACRFTNYEQLADKTVLYYDLEGNLGLQNAFIMLEDGNGERLTSEKDAERTNLEHLSFKREFEKIIGPLTLLTQVDATKTEVKQIKLNLE